MPSINPEMLKQLLQEFEEKQAVCREEINAIEGQIGELNKRILSSRERLESVARDREKVGMMKKRYAEGDWSSVLAALQADGKPLVMSQPAVAVATAPAPAVAAPSPAPTPTPAPAPAADIATFQQVQSANANPVASANNLPAYVTDTGEVPAYVPPTPTSFPDFTQAAPQPVAVELPPAPPEPAYQQPEAAPVAAAPVEAPSPESAASAQSMSWMPPPPPPHEPANEGLFPFSGHQQEVAAAETQAEIPWAPPPTMSWESINNAAAFTNQAPEAAPQPPAFQPYQTPQPQQPVYDQNQYPPQPPAYPAPAPDANYNNQQPAQGFTAGQTSQPPSQAVLTTAFDDEFDISDALRSEDENQQQGGPGERDNDKKIKDALRGLFS